VGLALSNSAASWRGPFGGGAPRPPLYGIWEIDKMTIDGVERPPVLTDSDRWRRLVIQRPSEVTFWRMDDTGDTQNAKVNVDARTITMTRTDSISPSHFTFEHPDAEHLVVDGEFDGRRIHMETHLFDRQKFLLVNRGFHWIQELPFNK
jgi:hypothetical protein